MILIVCPLAAELEIFRDHALDRARFHLALGGHGKVQFALETFRLAAELKPELIVCAGSAGGLAPQVKPLDVVVGEATIEHDFNLKFIKRDKPMFPGHSPTIERLRSLKIDGLHFGTIASGDEDVVSDTRAREIYAATSALAVAWEGAGGARAAAQLKIPYLEVRGITDMAGNNSVSAFKENLRPAMAKLAGILESAF